MGVHSSGDISDGLMAKSVWTDDDLDAHGIPRWSVPFVSVGGGVGSFAMVDVLRVAGVATNQIMVISDLDHPYETYEHLARNSQIPEHERLRSDSGSVLDCVWGWPGYAVREAIADRSFAPLWQVGTEPILADYYTPRAGQVYRSVDREVERIGWSQMLRKGVVRTIRRRAGGDYFVLYTPPRGSSETKRVAIQARFAHLAVGYPGVRFLPDLQAYRETYDDYQRVVNAYEPHNHIYEEMMRRPTTVLLRGSGIVASRVLQRIVDDRDRSGAQTKIVHLFRNYPDGWQGDSPTFRRRAKHGWAYQGFNFPKAAWGGQLRYKLEGLEGDERSRFVDALGGTNTAPRRDWREQLERGARDGFYQQAMGTVDSVAPSADGRSVSTAVRARDGSIGMFDADFILDATGLEAEIDEHRVLKDLLDHVGAVRNPKGRLDVERDFEIRGTANGEGRLFASGSITLGGYYAGVDSFLGLQHSALQIQDVLAGLQFGAKLSPGRSIVQWWKWARNEKLA